MSTVTERVTTAVETLAVRLADPVRCRAVATDPGNTDPFREMTPWEPMGLAHGYPGAALFWAELAREDPAAGRVANGFLREAMNSGVRASNGLYYGPASLLAAVQTLVTADGRERRMHADLVRWVAHNQIARADAWLTRLQTGGGVAWGAYDVINGLGGVGRLLLDEQGTDEVDRALRKTMEVFLTLAADTDVEGHRVPGWWVSAAGQPIPSDAEQYPRGDFNLGMAHGAAGILAFLAASVLAGAGGAEVEEALARTRTHLLGAAVRDEAGPYWPHGCRSTRGWTVPKSRWTRPAPPGATALPGWPPPSSSPPSPSRTQRPLARRSRGSARWPSGRSPRGAWTAPPCAMGSRASSPSSRLPRRAGRTWTCSRRSHWRGSSRLWTETCPSASGTR